MTEHANLLQVLALLLAAVVVVPITRRFGIPAVLGYLAAGIILGPYTPGPTIIDVAATRTLADLGVVFLLFTIGLELPVARLRAMRRFIFGLGVLQVTVTAAVLSVVAALFGLNTAAALVVGTTLACSSTATVLALLVEKNETVTRYGRVAVAVLILQDLAVVPLLALLPLLAGESTGLGGALGLAALKAVTALGGIYLLGRYVIRPAYRHISSAHTPEVFTAANLLLVLAVGLATAEAGMSMALGAFLAGLLLADSAYRHQVEADIEPFRGLLLGLFFMTVGMSIDLPLVGERIVGILGITGGMLALKALILLALGRLFGLEFPAALRVGLLLAQGGEFAFVILGKAASLEIVAGTDSQVLLAAVALSMALTPPLAALGRSIAGSYRQRRGAQLLPGDTSDFNRHVVIAGYGRVGRAVARVIASHDIPYVALDLDPDRVARERDRGLPVYFGDASQVGVLRAVGIDRARAAVITVNQPRMAERAVETLRREAPDLIIFARAHDLGQRFVLEKAGASAVVPETLEASLQIAGLVLRATGVPIDTVEESLEDYRKDNYDALARGVAGGQPAGKEDER